MEIISKLINMEVKLPVSNELIEQKLKEMGIKPLRWAIVECCSRCKPVSICGDQTEQGELNNSDVRIYNNKIMLTISLACENL